ncbi:uncharacterized protein LOC126581163 isoform X1 [Anopheles aquasalis]|uniref:uncharacterized protein LOC126581163 isoform X1 n=1 Tax=Anopheles aquasalis TaxID=42839 RepID=UPI00215B6FE4|nr:uncharacterized protein LOC126581163 isoform X1 [Anopheles aquasalis]
MNLNERIISTQLFAQTIDETATTTTSVGSSVGLSVGFAPFVAAATVGLASTSATPATTALEEPANRDPATSSSSVLAKQNPEHLTSPHRLHPHHANSVAAGAAPPPHHAVGSPNRNTNKSTGKSRSLSTGSYITKESSVHSSAERLTKSNSNTEVNVNPHGSTPPVAASGSVMPQNKSLEEGRSMITAKSSPPVRKPILRKSKKIVRTDSEFLKGNIYEKESSVSSSQYTPTRDRRREQFADYRSSNPSSETHKSTDESSKNISTDEIDTVFSDTMDLEQLEQDYRMHLKNNNLQREYKSDSDTLDEVGKKRPPDYWKNQSYENTFDVYAKETAELAANGRSSKDSAAVTERIPEPTSPRADTVSAVAPAVSSTGVKKDRPTELELGSTSDGGSKSTTADGPFGHLFEKNLGRFKRMNKLLKCKRFSTSALYERKAASSAGDNGATSRKATTFSSPTKSSSNPPRSPVKSILSQSKASISSSKSSLFGNKKPGSGFTFKGKKFLFTGKTSPNKSKSNNEISYYRTKSTKNSKKGSLKNNSTACLNLETTCTSPLSEAFYNTTGSVRLSAMELYEKFCSQDFSGLYKHETVRTDTDGSGTDSSHYEGSHRQLGAIRKYRRRNFKLLRQKSEPKFSFRTDTLYEDSYDGVCYHDEKDEEEQYTGEQFLYDEQYYEEDIEHYSIENIYYQRNALIALPDGRYVQRFPYRMEDDGEPDEGDEEGDEEEEEEEDEEGEEELEEEEEEEEEELGEEEEEVYQGEDDEDEHEFDEEDEDNLDEDGNELPDRGRTNRLQLPAPIEMTTSMDSDCDEIYLMPQNTSESKKLIIQDFLFHHSNNEYDTCISGDDYDIAEVDEEAEEEEGDGASAIERQKDASLEQEEDFRLARYIGPDKETLTIYKIGSKESILDSIKSATPEKDATTIPHSVSMEQYFLKSDCVTTLERAASLDLLSNSSGTLNKSTLTDYAFDTVRNINLDSCSTSRLSLSLKSEIFEETANGSSGGGTSIAVDPQPSAVGVVESATETGTDAVPRIKSWNIEDFTLTPEESFSDEQLPLDGPGVAEHGGDPSTSVTPSNEDIVRISELLQERLDQRRLSSPTEPVNLPPVPSLRQDNLQENEMNASNAEYTIVDLDEEPYLHDPSISEFTSEITKEFDLLFSRAETESLAAAAADRTGEPSPVVEPSVVPPKSDAPPAAQLGDVLKLLSDLPTRYSMQMLDHINLDVDDIRISSGSTCDEGLDDRPTVDPVTARNDPVPPPPIANPSRATQPPASAKPPSLRHPAASGRSASAKAKSSRASGRQPKTAATTPTSVGDTSLQIAPETTSGQASQGGSVSMVVPASSRDRLKKARSQSLGNLRNKTKCFPL